MYFYSNPQQGPRHAISEAGELAHPEDNDRASLCLWVEEEDRHRATHAHTDLEALERGLLTQEQVACTIASMRQNLELVLIMHSIQASLPRQSVHDVADQAATGFLGSLPGGVSARLRSWASALALEIALVTCKRFGIALA